MKNVFRLDQLLSRYGYCSRSEARAWLRAGRVSAGGEIMSDPAKKADPCAVLVDGAPIDSPGGILALLHKPMGVVCSHDVREGATIYDLLPPRWLRRNPPVTSIGRLDKDTTGVLLITDVGPLVQRWTSPRHHVSKLYEVTVDRDLDAVLVPQFASGTLHLPGEKAPCLPAQLTIVTDRTATLELTEGVYHQVKRMFACCGYVVQRLHRSRFHEVTLGDLAPGEWRLLDLPAETSTSGKHRGA